MHTYTRASLLPTHTHTQMVIHPCRAELLTLLWKKWGCQGCAQNMFWLLWLWLHILKVFTERPVTSVSCNWWDNVKTFKIYKLLQLDCTVWWLDWGKRDKSFHPDWLPWHVTMSCFSCVRGRSTVPNKGLKPFLKKKAKSNPAAERILDTVWMIVCMSLFT